MQTPEQPLPKGGMSREAMAMAEIGQTRVAPLTAKTLVGAFLLAVGLVPLTEWRAVSVRSAEILSAHADKAFAQRSIPGLWRRTVSMNRSVLEGIAEFERALEDESSIGRTLRPRAQIVMTGSLGVGNERVYAGRDGWLFYRPDVEYVTGRPFLDRAQIRRRVRGAAEWTAPPAPDPRPAIVRFKQDLDARGITLIVLPIPVKAGVHPEMLSTRLAETGEVLHNSSYRSFIDDLRAAGVSVFDPSEALAAARHSGPQYLATDTHWKPEAMETIAQLVADFMSAALALPPAPDPGYRVDRAEVRNAGDIERMLDLPESVRFIPPEHVSVRRILQPDGSPWRSSREADVLLLGDSFTNVYSLESMGWGTSAGFAEHVSFALRRPLDRLVQNDQGAFATRALLRREPGRLDGKRVVIYQFAVRELTHGDWAILPVEH